MKGERSMRKAESTQSHGIVVSIQYRSIEASKSTTTYPPELVKYPVSIYLGEAVMSASESVLVPFTVIFESEPNVASFKIKGTAFVKGPSRAVRRFVLSENGEPPMIWPKVYQDILLVISTLAEHLRVIMPEDLRPRQS